MYLPACTLLDNPPPLLHIVKIMIKNWITLTLILMSLNLTKAQAFSQIDSVRAIVFSWSHTWESKDIDKYMSFYSRHFRTENLDYDQWKAKKSRLFMKPCNLSVKISDLSVCIENRVAMTNFIQQHHCGEFQDIGEKTLILANVKNGWKIISEEWKPLDGGHQTYRNSGIGKEGENRIRTPGKRKKHPPQTSVHSILSEKTIGNRIKVQTGKEMDRILIDISKVSLPDFSTIDGKTPGILIDLKNVSSWKGKPTVSVNGFLITTIKTRFHKSLNKVSIIMDLKPNEDYIINRIHYMDKKVLLIEVRKA